MQHRIGATCLLLCTALACWSASAQELKEDSTKDYVSEVLPYSIDEVYARAQMLFDSERRDYYEDYNPKIYDLPEQVQIFKQLSPAAQKKFLALPLVRPNKAYVFYGAYASVQDVLANITPVTAMGHTNAALQRYAALPGEKRSYDLYVWSPDTPYWHSGYWLDGVQLPFKTYFIVHLSAVDESHTQVEIIENEPTVRIAHYSSVDIYGKVHPYTLREVEPTTSDREFLLSCVRQFIERKVPGRHWFRCRDAGEVEEKVVPFTVP